MRALVAAGTRQKPRQQNGSDKPCERRDLKGGGRAAHRKIDRECRESREASKQPRRHERTMARARQRVISRRRVQQCVQAIADNAQNYHGSRTSAESSNRRAGNAPIIVTPPCQSDIKRTLKALQPTAKERIFAGFSHSVQRAIQRRW